MKQTYFFLFFLLFTPKILGDYLLNKQKRIGMMKRRGRPIRNLGIQGMTQWWVTWGFFWPHSLVSHTEVRGVRHWQQKPGLFKPTTRKRAAYQHRKHLYNNCSLQSNITEENFNKVWVEGLVPPSADHKEYASTLQRWCQRRKGGGAFITTRYQWIWKAATKKCQQLQTPPSKEAPTKLFNKRLRSHLTRQETFR